MLFRSKANLENVTNGELAVVQLTSTHVEEKPLDTCSVTGSEFEFKFDIPEPRLLLVILPQSKNYIYVMASPGDNITLTGNSGNPVIAGASLHPKFDKLYNQSREEMNKKYSELGGNDEFFKYIEERIDNEVLAQKDSWWGPLLLMTHLSYLSPDMAKYYEQFSDDAKNSFYGKMLKKGVIPDKLTSAPDFSSNDKDGKSYDLKAVSGDKKYLLIDFWASWCAPCRKSLPKIKEAYSKYEAQGLEIVGISIDKEHDKWVKALIDENMSWVNLIDTNGIADKYGVKSVPSVFLIDLTTGEVLGERMYGDAIYKKLEEVFGF